MNYKEPDKGTLCSLYVIALSLIVAQLKLLQNSKSYSQTCSCPEGSLFCRIVLQRAGGGLDFSQRGAF